VASAPEQHNIRYAEHFPAKDCGGRINAADQDLGASAGEIWINQTCGGASTPINLSRGHSLRFIQGGSYRISGINMATNTWIFCGGTKAVTLAAYPGFTGTMIKTTAPTDQGDNGIQGCIIDGMFRATVGMDLSVEVSSFLRDVHVGHINGTGISIHDSQGIVLENVSVNQCSGNNIEIVDSFGVNALGIFSERPGWSANGAIPGSTAAAIKLLRDNERFSLASSNAIYGLHIEWEPEPSDNRDAVLIDGADQTVISNFALSSGGNSGGVIANAIRVVNTSNVSNHLSYTVDNLRILGGRVVNLINDTINARTVPSAVFGNRLMEFSSNGEGTSTYGSYVAGQPTGAPVEFGVWNMGATNAPWVWQATKDGSSQFLLHGNRPVLRLLSGQGAVVTAVRSGTTSNTDLAGQLILAGSSQTYRFTGTYTIPPVCVATDITAANPLQVNATTSTLTIVGTGGDTVNYICMGRN
jgi:hypothetical protein